MKNISTIIILLLGTRTLFATYHVRLTDTVMGIRLNTARELIDANKDLPKAKKILLEIKNSKPEKLNDPDDIQAARQFLKIRDRELHRLLLEIADIQKDKPKIKEYSEYLGVPY